MKYFTAKGDTGTSKLFGCQSGERLSKGEGAFELLGVLDELNSFLGFARVVAGRSGFRCLDAKGRTDFLGLLLAIQNALFLMQAELAGAPKRLPESKLAELERQIERFADAFPEVSSFVIPGGTELGALLDVCRTVARRVERLYIRTASGKGQEDSVIGRYLNRLSSALYVLARCANHCAGAPEQAPSYQ